LTSSVNAAQEEQEDAELINEEPSWWLDRVGRWKTSTALDWTIGSDNPQFVYRQSESHSIMILNDQYLLTRTITDGLEALVIEGFREDVKQFWALSMIVIALHSPMSLEMKTKLSIPLHTPIWC
tara:strand:+ start:302 stop:673 length:372 start_codon:yes stop_codon:yes gene_type:complete